MTNQIVAHPHRIFRCNPTSPRTRGEVHRVRGWIDTRHSIQKLPQSHLTRPQHRVIQLALRICIRCAGEEAIELRAVIGVQQEVGAGVEHFHHRPADIVLVDRSHHEVIRDDEALEFPLLADQPVDHCFGVRGRPIRIDRGQIDVADHQLRMRSRQHLLEGAPIGRLKLGERGIEARVEQMGVAVHTAQSGKCFTVALTPKASRPRT